MMLDPPVPADPVLDPWEALCERLENYYAFACEGGPLKNCVEWQRLKSMWQQVAQQHAQAMNDLRIEHRALIATEAAAQCRIGELEAALAQRTQELQLNASMLARQCDLARDAENERDRLQAAHTALQEQLREMIQHWQTTAQLNEFLVSRVGGEPVFPYRWFAKELEALLPPPTPPGART